MKRYVAEGQVVIDTVTDCVISRAHIVDVLNATEAHRATIERAAELLRTGAGSPATRATIAAQLLEVLA